MTRMKPVTLLEPLHPEISSEPGDLVWTVRRVRRHFFICALEVKGGGAIGIEINVDTSGQPLLVLKGMAKKDRVLPRKGAVDAHTDYRTQESQNRTR